MCVFICVCSFSHRLEEGVRSLKLGFQVVMRYLLWVPGNELHLLWEQQVLSCADLSLRPEEVYVTVKGGAWCWHSKTDQETQSLLRIAILRRSNRGLTVYMEGKSPKVRPSHGLRRPWMKSRRDRRDTDTQLNISHQKPMVSKARTNSQRGGHLITICSVETLMVLPGQAKIQRCLDLTTIQCQLQQRICQLLYI